MTAAHFVFAALMTVYILIAIPFEERNLVSHFGDQYEQYRSRVGALIPRIDTSSAEPKAERGAV